MIDKETELFLKKFNETGARFVNDFTLFCVDGTEVDRVNILRKQIDIIKNTLTFLENKINISSVQ